VRMIQGEGFGLSPDTRGALVEATTALYRKLTRPLTQHSTARYRSNLRIGCFSETATSVPMWAHYAACHSGLCIQWDISDFWPSLIEQMFPVVYDAHPFQMPSLAVNPSHPGAEIVLALRKALEWSYEREWRCLASATSGGAGYLEHVPRPAVVYLGLLMADQDRERVARLCRERRIRVSQIRCDLELGSLVAGEP
jgi:hypothetical protein